MESLELPRDRLVMQFVPPPNGGRQRAELRQEWNEVMLQHLPQDHEAPEPSFGRARDMCE